MTEKRRIRKTSVLEKVKNYPYDVYLNVNEVFASIDWDEYSKLAIVGSNVVTLLFIVLNKLSHVPVSPTASIFQVDPYKYDRFKQQLLSRTKGTERIDLSGAVGGASPGMAAGAGSLIFNINQVLIMSIYLASVIITYQLLFNSTRQYSLINTTTKPRSPNAKESLISEDSNSRVWDIVASVLKFFNKNVEEESYYNDSETTTNVSSDEYKVYDDNKVIYLMDVWQPTEFNLILFSFINPISLVMSKVMLDLSVWKIGLIVLLFDFQIFQLSTKFLTLISDKQILYQEMFQEYNDKYVKPKTNILKQDVGIDATNKYFDNNDQMVVDHSNPYFQNTKSKVFIVHDINGKPVNTISKDDIDENRKQLDDEKIRLELEREKLLSQEKLLNSSMDSEWLRYANHSTPFKTPRTRDVGIGADHNRSSIANRSYNTSYRDRSGFSRDTPRSVSPGKSARSPTRTTRPISPIRQSPVKPSGMSSPSRTGRTSPVRNGMTSPTRYGGRIASPERADRSTNLSQSFNERSSRLYDRTPTYRSSRH